MAKQLVKPLVQSFLVCRHIFEDARTHEFILISPCSELFVPAFPGTIRFTVFAELKLHGDYVPEFALEDSDATTIWTHRAPRPVAPADPILPRQFVYYDIVIDVPGAGRYDLLLLKNGDEIARHALWVRAHRSPGRERGSD
jgi:hypothetical protein